MGESGSAGQAAAPDAERARPALRAVILDLDGVLIDSESVALRVLCELLHEEGVERTVADVRHLCGRRADVLRAYLQDTLGDAARGSALADASKAQIQARIAAGEMKPFPGAREAVARLRDAGLRLAIASSSHRERVERELAGSGIAELVEAVITGEEVERSKPHPEIFLRAAQAIGVEPSVCAVVEDSLAGVEAGKRAGMTVFAVAQTFPGEELGEADEVLASIADLPEVLLDSMQAARTGGVA